MKRCAISLLLAGGITLSGQAQLFSPEAFTGALFGTFVGGIAGADHCHGFSGEGAAIGAGVGFLAGALVGEANRRASAYEASTGFYGYAPMAQPGYGYVYAPVYAPAPVVVAPPPRPNYAIGGTAVGALAGGLIGAANNRGWEGAGIGAASGLVVGTVAEAAARKAEQKRVQQVVGQAAPGVPQVQVAPPTQPAAAVPAPVVAARVHSRQVSFHSSPAARPQIPDAPMVPDAPSF